MLCLAALPLRGEAQPARGFELLPHDTPFRSPLADPAEPRLFLSGLRVRRPAGEFGAAFLGVGHDFGLLRRSSANPDHGWQLSIFGSADSLFNMDLPGDALVNTDYRIGFPLTWSNAPVSARVRLYHQSSHLGDELILGGNAPQRLDMSFEATDVLLAWERTRWRLYGGASHVLRTRLESYKGSTLHAGFDYVGPPAYLGLRTTMGLDVKWLEATGWRAGVSAKAGLKLGRESLERRGVTLLVELYDGFAPFGQFFAEDWRYYGARLQFDF